MSEELAALSARIQRLEDESDLKILKGRYCEHCDNGYDPDGIASLFTSDGVWDGGFMGRFEGREAIREHFEGVPDVMIMAIHHVTNPIIEIDGDVARAQWYLWQPCTNRSPRAIWLAARYNDTCVRTADGWRFKEMIISPKMFAPYGEGWAEVPFLAGGPRDDDLGS